MSKHTNVDAKMLKACEDVSELPLAMGNNFSGLIADWLPLIREAMVKFGLELATTSLPALREIVENWQAKGFLMKMVRKQLISAIAEIETLLERDSSLGDLMFAK